MLRHFIQTIKRKEREENEKSKNDKHAELLRIIKRTIIIKWKNKQNKVKNRNLTTKKAFNRGFR